MKRRSIITVAGFVISIVLLYFSLKGIQFREIINTLKNADYSYTALTLFFIAVSVIFCCIRWSRIAGNNVTFKEAFVALFIGLFVNNVLPARIGEIARAYVISKKANLSFTYSFSTVLVDRFFDLIGLLIITFMFFPKHKLPASVSHAINLLIILLVICIILMIIMSREKSANVISAKLGKIQKPFFKKLAHRVIEIQENLKRIHSPFNMIFFIIISFLQWFSMSLSLYFVARMLSVNVPFSAIPFVCALLNMGLTIPSSPGYVGVYQFLLVYLLSIFAVPKYEGFTISVIYHAAWYIPYNIIGFIFLIKEHLKIRDIQRMEEES